jgi:D-alanyl-lipoteichoic acid acyltransferase DltB (MBOAT superfamily)
MRLDSAAFLAIFAVFFVVYGVVPSRAKRVLLVLGSLGFYFTLARQYLPLLLGLGVFTFLVGAQIHRSAERRRDLWLWLGVGANLAALVEFKGAAGIAFYSLQAISYLVDVHRRTFEPPRSLVAFLGSFTLFPHLLAGPIVRTSFLLPLIEKVEAVSWPVARRALLLFTVGLAKKAIADKLAPIADGAFDATGAISPFQAWTGLIAYAAQLYGDFSGYTDMATGIALLLGLDLPPNFDLPYLAISPADFWRRWHISLSSWLRDYVYFPLGVRFRRQRTMNLVLTWIVAGLWHGATWLYVVYGAYHGVLLAATDWLARRFDADAPPSGLRRVAQTALTFYLVLIGYVLFRARSLRAAAHYLAALHTSKAASVFTRATVTPLVVAIAAIVFCHALDYLVRRRRAVAERAWLMWPAMAVAVTCLALFSGPAQPFIYFAF